jgi:hypothetical protein
LAVVISVRRVVIAGMLLVAAVVWVLINGPFEGPTLLVLTPGHGITLADLASAAAGTHLDHATTTDRQ